jgi:type I restriction enzyme S subunit
VTYDLEPYPAYKDSGVPWLGTVPAHWHLKRAKYSFREVDERSITGQQELLTVSHITGVTPRRERNVTMFLAESNVGHKLCRPNDVVINTMWAWMAALGVAKQVGLVSPSYSVYRPRRSNTLLPEYVDLLLRTHSYASEYLRRSTGINTSRLRLYPEQFLAIPLICPPNLEQSAIVRFLGHADRRIRRCIRAKQKLIKLLGEQKQAIIYGAVTRGLDPNVRLKPSGIEWPGDVPEHWSLSRVKNEFACLNSRRVPLSSTERGAMMLRRYDYYGASAVIDKVDDYLFDDELLLIAEDGANLVLRNLPLAIIACGKFWVNNHAHILKPRRGNLEFLANLMESLTYLPWISGAAQPKLTQDRLLAIAIAVPPRDEQDRIMRWVTGETAPLRVAISQATGEISLLRKYRTRLIADVVTGKLDVRAAAASLPDDADDVEALNAVPEEDDTDTAAEGNEEGEALDLEAPADEAEA